MKACKLLMVALFALFIGLSSCKKHPPSGPTTFTLQMNAKYGTQSFALNSYNADSINRYVVMSSLEFYLSHINLIKSDGSKVKVADVAIFNFDPAASSLSVSVNNVSGDFMGISFACGLDSVTNNTDSAGLYPISNPLSGLWNMPWPMIKYQFEIVEGKWDTAVIPIMRHPLIYHIGTNAAYRQTQLNTNFSVSGTPYTMVLYLDLAQIFKNTTTGETINMTTEGSSMSANTDNPAILPKFADNFSNAFTLTGP